MKANVPHAARLLVVSAAIAVLASCGGGGGGGGGPSGPPPTTQVALSAGNMQPVTDDVLNMSVSFVSVGASNSSTLGEVPLLAQPRARPRTRPVLELLRKQLGSLSARSPTASSFTALAAPPPVNCDLAPDGSTGTFTTDPVPPAPAQPTSITLTFSNCFSAGETIDGTVSLTNIGAPAAGETTGHVNHNLKFVQSGVPDLTSSGDFDIDHKVAGTLITDTLTGGPVTVSLGGDIAIISGFTITSSFDSSSSIETDSIAGTIGTGAIGGTVTVATSTPFQTANNASFPNTGQLIITGASNSAVRFTVLGDETAVGDQVTIEVDPEGDGTFEAPVGFTWAGL
jgi:hypothetical protein